MKSLISRTAERLGYTLMPTWRLPELPLAMLTRDVLSRSGIDLVLDIGANKGQYRDFLRLQAFYSGQIVSFEPQRDLAEKLARRATTDNCWQVHNLALGSGDGELQFNVMERTEFSSFLQPDNSSHPQFAELNRIRATTTVRVKRIDSISLSSSSRIFLKTDTQGFDLEVIRGAEGILDNIFAIQAELSVQPIYKGMPRYRDVINEIESLGFMPAGFFPVSRAQDLSAIEFDCLFVRHF